MAQEGMEIADLSLGALSAAASMILNGKLEKAIIKVYPIKTSDEIKVEKPVSSGESTTGLGGGMPSGLPDASNLPGADRLNDLADAAGDLAPVKIPKKGDGSRQMSVQFNPESLRLTGYASEPDMKANNIDHADKSSDVENTQAASMSHAPRLEFSVRLVFDACEVIDAFLSDKLNLASGIASAVIGGVDGNFGSMTGALASNAKNGIKAGLKAAGKLKTTVQPEVEGLIGAMKSTSDNTVEFNWGPLCYRGSLHKVNATYTMFNANGEPIRAYVDVTLILFDDSTEGNMKSMKDIYKELFAKGNVSAVTTGQKVGSLLNL